MQRVIDLRSRQRASGAPEAPLNVDAEPPQRSETFHDRMRRQHSPDLTNEEIDELAALHGS